MNQITTIAAFDFPGRALARLLEFAAATHTSTHAAPDGLRHYVSFAE